MIKKILTHKISPRLIVFAILTSISYILSIIYLFEIHDLLWSITCVFITFILFHFLFIDIKKIKQKYFILLLITIILLEICLWLIIWWINNIRIVLALISFNWAIWALYFSLEMLDFSSISYFTRWWFIFTMFISITYSIAVVWIFQEFPFTCQWLNDASNKLYEFIEAPFSIFKNKSLQDDKFWKDKKHSIYSIITNIWDLKLSSKINNKSNPIIERFNKFKFQTIDQIMADQSEYNDWVCDLLLNEINTILENNGIKISVILLSYFLLYWFIRIAIFIMSGIAFIIFKILYWCKVYKIEKVTINVDEIF